MWNLALVISLGLALAATAAIATGDMRRAGVSNQLLILAPVTHEVLGSIEERGGRRVFVSCNGDVYQIAESHVIEATQDLC